MISYFLKQNREGPKEFADLKKETPTLTACFTSKALH